ncbi:DUF805 domain-containing protein [Neptunomonas antarctica]|uniref:Uncharacterized membrane protein YhaH, DUF805 family n=1 Tax=Neptunomonas antarctica TaxID=619304 RepID=A0A1N7MKU3_9GAMM|nr:DUF805 domain-containing protein [Neptunomonas antarctica]SIS86723.1 Uncharacterized membrane protein YhaH, DUF805 family [Neptunomonas antarctica]
MDWYLQVIRKYTVFTGRAGREEYWYFVLINILISIAMGFIDGFLGLGNGYGTGLLAGLYSLFVLLPSIAVSVRRLHDIGRTGWWVLIILIPLLGWIALLVMMAFPGQPDNEYGLKISNAD